MEGPSRADGPELKSAAGARADCTQVLQTSAQMAQTDLPPILLLEANDRMMILCVVISLNYSQHMFEFTGSEIEIRRILQIP